MKITSACEQYFNAYRELGNWKNNNKWTNLGLVIEVISYFSLVAPLIVLATYTTASLAGRIAQKSQPSNLDAKTFVIFKNVLFLGDLPKLSPAQQKEEINGLQSEEFEKIINDLGGIDAFLEKLNKADPNILNIPLVNTQADEHIIKYALLSKEEVKAFPLNQLSLPMTSLHVQILKAQLNRFPKIDHEKLLPLDDLSNLTLSAFNSHVFTKDQLDKLMNTFGEGIINFISEEQIKDFILNKKINEVSGELYRALFHCLDDTNVNKMRFALLSHDKVKEVIQKFAGHSIDLFSDEQASYFFGNLKAGDIDQSLYNNLFPYYTLTISEKRFQLISKEEAANIVKKLEGRPIGLLSEEQAKYFFGNLKASDMDQTMHKSLFSYHGSAINKKRFQLIPKEEATNIAKKLEGRLIGLFSEEQAKYFFGNLKATEIDLTLYNNLFPYFDSNTKKRFQLFPKDEAANIVKKFPDRSKDLLSEEQAKYFFGNLKADEVDQALYNNLFPYFDVQTNKKRFELISKEQQIAFNKKFLLY